ncbi:hypothetical protein B0H21DRAFT_703965 [Amylocystis lapponica]|nr:hypothetical protein B0H21DRAFT_703965 [Amylocystis lapponica]
MPHTRYGHLVSPINRLPVELLSYIFTIGAHVHDTDGAVLRPRLYDSRHEISPCLSYSPSFPYLVASVSTHWRQIALTTPQLWSKICLTVQDVAGDLSFESDDSHSLGYWALYRHLSRSSGYPLDILIDARDPDWDFSEYDISTAGRTPFADDDPTDDYIHPFSVAHMQLALNILLPHFPRCRSLAILTDRWAPMHTALQCLGSSDYLLASNASCAPLLERLVLMRCNEFASYSPNFMPRELRAPTFLPFGGLPIQPRNPSEPVKALPRLRYLTLSGVHVPWSLLPDLLPHPLSPSDNTGLHVLELSYHSSEVRQSNTEFFAALRRCPRLEDLTIRLSGPKRDSDRVGLRENGVVSLPHLTALTLGYDDSLAAIEILRQLDAPNLQMLTLEDASYPTAEDYQDSGPLLAFCSAGTHQSQHLASRPVFPQLDTATLHGVKASRDAFRMFFGSCAKLRALTLAHTALSANRALRPRAEHCPCPMLTALSIHGTSQAMDPSLGVTLATRAGCGAPLRNVRLEAEQSVALALDDVVGEEDKYGQTITRLVTEYQTASYYSQALEGAVQENRDAEERPTAPTARWTQFYTS